MTQNIADGAGVRVMADRCSTCIFRSGNLMHLRQGRVRDMVDQCKRTDSVIPCHDTLDDDKQAVCRGFFDAHASAIWPLRLAIHTGAIVEHVR